MPNHPEKMKTVESGITDPTQAHRDRRRDLESKAIASMTDFVRALWSIQSEGLHRWTHATWKEYLTDVWGITPTELHRRQRLAVVQSEVGKRAFAKPVDDDVRLSVVPILTSESATKALARVPEADLPKVLDLIENADPLASTMPIVEVVKAAIKRVVPEETKQPTKPREVNATADSDSRRRIETLGNELCVAARGYSPKQLYNVVAAAIQQLRGIAKEMR